MVRATMNLGALLTIVSQQICNNEVLPCAPGLYCPGEAVLGARLCKRGQYCPTPNTTEDCTINHFCPTFTVDPRPCLVGSFCGGKNRKDLWFLLILLEIIVFAVGVAVWCCWSKRSSPGIERTESTVKLTVAPDTGKAQRMDMSISNVGVVITHKKAKRELLSSATGEFLSGRLVAIMGPSGAGKTTLLNVMSGRIKHTSGNVYINGVKTDIEKYDKLVGFVPQDDTMLRVLTIRQILDHSARMRLPATMSWAQKREVVDSVIDMLGLAHIQNSQIGDEVTRGISGGERKRVNIGIELVAKPSLLFLDEPTTGLDSASAKDVVSCLHEIARMGITVVAVVHQPRFDILSLCDDLLLLGKGGKTVYMGATSNALAYFKVIGYECPPNLNPADFFIDITSGRLPIDPNSPPATLPPPPQPQPAVLSPRTRAITSSKLATSSTSKMPAPPTLTRETSRTSSISGVSDIVPHSPPSGSVLANRSESGSPSMESGSMSRLLASPLTRQRADSHEFDPSDLITQWDTRARAMSKSIDTTMASNNGAGASVSLVTEKNLISVGIGPSTGFFVQFSLLFYRCLLQQVQDTRSMLVELLYQFLPGLALGYAINFELYTPPIPAMLIPLCPAVVRGKCENDPVGRQVEQIIFYITMVASAAAAATATSRFGLEKANFKRERRSGINIYAYFLAKNVYDLIDVVRCTLLFIGTFFILGGATGQFRDWFAVMFMMSFAAYGMGYFISTVTNYNKAMVVAVVCCIMWSVTSGLSPTLAQVFWWVSYARWGAEAINLTLTSDFPLLKDRIDHSFRHLGFDPNGWGLDMGMLLVIGVVWRMLAFMGLIGVRKVFRRYFPKRDKIRVKVI